MQAAELLPDDNDAQIKAGNFMLAAGQFADAQGVGERLLAKSPKSVEAQVLIANALAGLKDLESAVDAFEKAVQIDPSRACDVLGARRGTDVREAIRSPLKPRSVRPSRSTRNPPLALISLANFVWSTGDADQGEQLMKRALEADPKSVIANRALAMFYLVRNKVEAAEPHLKAVADASTDPRSRNTRWPTTTYAFDASTTRASW